MFFRKPERKPDAPVEAPPASPAPVAAPPKPTASGTPPPVPAASAPAAQPPVNELAPEEAKRRALIAKQMAASFGELVMLLMRSQPERQYSLADLEWLAVPAVVNGQIALAEAQARDSGVVTPVGGLLWAFVSPEVDARLSDVSQPVKLQPNEWKSGEILWIVLAVGDKRVVGGLLEKLMPTFKGKSPKMRARGPDGKVSVGTIEVKPAAAVN